jgi:hypothetical protein
LSRRYLTGGEGAILAAAAILAASVSRSPPSGPQITRRL